MGSGITLSPDGDIFTVGVSTIGALSLSGIVTGTGALDPSTGTVTTSGDITVGGDLTLESVTPVIKLTDSNQEADNKTFMISGSSTQKLRIQALTDAGGGGGELFEFVRDGNNVEKFQGAKSAVPWFVVDNNIKKVGIGTTSPQHALQISNGASSTILLGNTGHGYMLRANVSSANDYGFLIEDEDGVDLYRATSSTGTNAADTHIWSTAGSERLRIASAGQIGIAGANYGNDNQALTSQGSSASVEWRGVNTPAWDSYQTSTTSIPTGAWTLVGGFTEVYDSDGAFASSTFTVPAGKAGIYFVYGIVTIDDIQSADYIIAGISLNGGEPGTARRGTFATAGSSNARLGSIVNCMMNLSVGDEIRLSCLHNEGSTEPTEQNYTRFGGYRLSV